MTPRESPNKINFGSMFFQFFLGLLSITIVTSVGFLFTAVNSHGVDIRTTSQALEFAKEKLSNWIEAEKEWRREQKERDKKQDEEIEKLKEYRRRQNNDE